MGTLGKKSPVWILAAVGALTCFTGCEDTAKHVVKVQPPQIAAPSAQQETLLDLPINAQHKSIPTLTLIAPEGAEWVMAQSQAAFDAGEEDFQAGHLGKAREEFDEALDQLLASGIDLEANPRLNDLYRHIVDTVSHDELEAFHDGDGFREQKSTPAAIDEIAEEPIPELEVLDPNLRGRAEGEVGAISHDLPLTVNDPVLAYLNYFKTPRGSAIVETGLRRAGRYRAMVQRVLDRKSVV